MNFRPSLPICWRASVVQGSKFISIRTFSGYARSMSDAKGADLYLDPGATDVELGTALREALEKSRFVLPKDDPELYDYESVTRRYNRWAEKTASRFGYASPREALKKTRSCSVEKALGEITIMPYRQIGIGDWEEVGPESNIVIPDDTTVEELGAALRLGLSRCL